MISRNGEAIAMQIAGARLACVAAGVLVLVGLYVFRGGARQNG